MYWLYKHATAYYMQPIYVIACIYMYMPAGWERGCMYTSKVKAYLHASKAHAHIHASKAHAHKHMHTYLHASKHMHTYVLQ